MPIDSQLLAVLACPEDKGPLLYFADEDALYNPRLRRRYAVTGGIPVMLVDEAETVSAEEDARLLQKAEGDGIEPNFVQDEPGRSGDAAAGPAPSGSQDEPGPSPA